MGIEQTYKCKKCGKFFRAQAGGGVKFDEYRCMLCDTIKNVETRDKSVSEKEYIPPTKEEIGMCDKCGGGLRNDIGPMCPKCGARDIEETDLGTTILYD
ncbi:MAG: hypothetical protein KAJ14_03385 [Candidatus Omnitrophica bacterium]|nr:hypothetical protein [Candidatus Omnitrophota bacterium]